MGKTIDCYYWDRSLGLEDEIDFTYEDIGNEIELKRPVFTNSSLEKIIESLKKARNEYLLKIDVPTVLDVIENVTNKWADPNYKRRKIALNVLPTVTGFSPEMIEAWGFDHFMKILRKENLSLFGKLKPDQYTDFKELNDGFVKAYGEQNISHSNYDPEIVGHICAGNILGIAAFEMILDKLIDAATWIKVPSEEPVFGTLYAKSIEEVDPQLAKSIAILPFSSKDKEVREFLFSKSDMIRATGGS